MIFWSGTQASSDHVQGGFQDTVYEASMYAAKYSTVMHTEISAAVSGVLA